MPTALAMPCPSRLVVSMPAVMPTSGMARRLAVQLAELRMSSIDRSITDRCSSEYGSIEPWPFDTTKRSRLANAGWPGCGAVLRPQRHRDLCHAHRHAPVPDLAAATASTASMRIALAAVWAEAEGAGVVMREA